MRWWEPGPRQTVYDENGNPTRAYTAIDTRDPYAPPRVVTKEQFHATFDPYYRKKNPYSAGHDALGISAAEARGEDSGYLMGQALQRGWQGLHKTDLSAALTEGGIGAAVGLGGVGLANTFREARGMEPLGWKSKLMAGMLGATAGGALSFNMRDGGYKKASTQWSDSAEMLLRSALIRRIATDQDVDLSVRSQITAALGRLGGADLQLLARVASTFAGAGIGSVVARWLAGKGLISTLSGGILGGAAAWHMSRPATNAFGRTSLDAYR